MRALVVVDMQNDFMPDGALPVPKADEIIEPIAELIRSDEYPLVVVTQDWHPPEGPWGQWPQHCVAGTYGVHIVTPILRAMLTSSLPVLRVFKGMDSGAEGYSAFETPWLNRRLTEARVTDLDFVGVAADVCVKATADDAHRLGYVVCVLTELTRAVNSP